MSNLETVQEMYRRFAGGDTETIRAIFAPDLRWNMMRGFPGGGQYAGIDAVFAHVFGYFHQHWTHWQAHSTRFVETGTGVIVMGYYEGTYTATGRAVRADFAAEYTVCEGRITAYQQYTDTWLIAEAMGLPAAAG